MRVGLLWCISPVMEVVLARQTSLLSYILLVVETAARRQRIALAPWGYEGVYRVDCADNDDGGRDQHPGNPDQHFFS
jgi:hypothetical protein